MLGDMITLPLRIGACAARLGLRVSEQAAGAAIRTTWRLMQAVVPAEVHGAAGAGAGESRTVWFDVVVASPPPTSETASTPPSAPPQPSEAAPRDAAPAACPAPQVERALEVERVPAVERVPESAPAHVSEELRFVGAFAEPGAENGAGAAVHVKEPWKGYAQMTAHDVIARLHEATREELAAVELYEGVHRRRHTVLTAADRQLRRLAARAAEAPSQSEVRTRSEAAAAAEEVASVAGVTDVRDQTNVA